MKSVKKVRVFSFFAVSTILLFFGYSFSSINPLNFFNFFSITDTLDNPPQNIIRPQDLGGMFNERGFMKSNSVSYDEQEIINDFNGNLMLNIPLYSEKGKGDLHFDLSLNYNGSVNHQIVTSDSSTVMWTFGILQMYNFTAPEWVFSVNGLAVQLMNFETNFFTKGTLEGSIYVAEGRYVRLIVPGYHVTDMLSTSSTNVPDYINVMMGDGSVEVLENTTANTYIGTYKPKTKNDYLTAYVEYIAGSGSGPVNRRMHLMKGDGLEYIYDESDQYYYDYYFQTGMPDWFRPQAFYLKQIKDRFGNKYNLYYGGTVSSMLGRGLFIAGPHVDFEYPEFWGNYFGVKVRTPDGYYRIGTEPFGRDPHSVHRPMVQRIINPSGEAMNFTYEPYYRTAENLINYYGGQRNLKAVFSASDEPLERLAGYTNFDGGSRSYSYKSSNGLTLSYIVPQGESGTHSAETYYHGQGRDEFFTNMLGTVTVNAGSGNIRSENFNYEYYYTQSDRHIADVWEYPIDSRDIYKTTRTVQSNQAHFNYNTPTVRKTVKTYKDFRINAKPGGNETVEYEGTTELMEENYSVSTDPPYKTVTHSYYMTGNSNQLYTGSFLEQTYEEDYENEASRTWSYEYQGGGDAPISYKFETDPLGGKTETYFTNFAPPSVLTVFVDGNYIYNSTNTYDYPRFYLIHQPNEIKIKSPEGNLVSRKTFEYYQNTNVTGTSKVDGYKGQIKEEIVYDVNNLGNPNAHQRTQYKYYNQDTTGYHLYGGQFHGSNTEGNLKETVYPNGNKTVYYYDMVSRSEEEGYIPCQETDEIACAPKLSYHIMKDDNTETIGKTYWRDYRFPSRIDNYADGQRYISTYMQYDNMGNPTEIVDPNKYYSQVRYEKYYRVSSITLPYDFSEGGTDSLLIFDTLSSVSQLTSPGTAWGYKDDNKTGFCNGECGSPNYCLRHDLSLAFGYNRLYVLKTMSGIEDLTDTVITGLVQFSDARFSTLINENMIDSAFLEIAPCYMDFTVGGTVSNNYSLVVKPLSQLKIIAGGNPVCSTGCATNQTGLCFVPGNGSPAVFPGLNFSTPVDCYTNQQQNLELYLGNHRRLNITSLIKNNIVYNQGLKLEGLNFDINYSGSPNASNKRGYLYFMNCLVNLDDYRFYANPKIILYGNFVELDTIYIPAPSNGTIFYNYDDRGNKVNVFSKIDKIFGNYRFKRTTHLFDGLRRLTESRMYKSQNLYDSVTQNYNYLDQKSRSTDARNLSTNYSYNVYGTLSETENEDNSSSLTSESYLSSLTTHWGSHSGFVHKQIYTDETERHFEKYFDAVGNLVREVKFASYSNPDTPYDPDSTYEGNDDPGDQPLYTDYRYDSLYRVADVYTPEGKTIHYTYDAFGRQKSRTTPDAGLTKYLYDKNNNLTYSQDANQRAVSNNVYTFRTYDGLNRLVTLGINPQGNPNENFDDLDGSTVLSEGDNPPAVSDYLLINVYDTLSSASIITFTPPSDYYNSRNNTKGNLVATAYRTRGTDNWNYKYYRYDARGMVIKMWNNIDGLEGKTMTYTYNSQNQVIYVNYNPGGGDTKLFRYSYDDAARLVDVSIYTGYSPPPEIPDVDFTGTFTNFTSYSYNENSQVRFHNFNDSSLSTSYGYNSRNWVQSFHNSPSEIFGYAVVYNYNGNIRTQQTQGSYQNNFTDNITSLQLTYTYDLSNRLVKGDFRPEQQNTKYDLINTYDKNGNILTLKRYGSSNNIVDNYSYTYISNTNKLSRVAGLSDQYTYDYTGNLTSDQLNYNYDMVYDHRNLLIESKNTISPNFTFRTRYYYDEAGNRIRKYTLKSTIENPPPPNWDNTDNPGDGWAVYSDEYYVRDVNGKEIAIYTSESLTQWNVYGLDNVGKVDANGDMNFYLKDHLGSIRAVVDVRNDVVNAQDFDMWGYTLQNRSYSPYNRYKFTGKERDKDYENNYDYFGARYYDSRIGRWGGVEPLLDKFVGFTPYGYSLNNPQRLADEDGKRPRDGQNFVTSPQEIKNTLVEIGERISSGYEKLFSDDYSGAAEQFISNVEYSPNVLSLIPSDISSDFIAPIGLVRETQKLLKLTKGASLEKAGEEIAEFIGRSRIEIGYGVLDIKGAPHYSKLLGEKIPTPHLKPNIFQYSKTKGFVSKSVSKATRRATMEDLQRAVKIINSKF
jgi:YD repeat-containing protein